MGASVLRFVARLAESQVRASMTPFHSRERLDGLVAKPGSSEEVLSWAQHLTCFYDGEGPASRGLRLLL